METHRNALKLDPADTKTDVVTKAIAISSPGNVAPLVRLLPGNNVEGMTEMTVTTAMEVLHLHGLLAAEAIIMVEAINKAATAVLLVAELPLGSNSKTLPHHLHPAVNMAAMVDTQEATEMQPVAMEGSREWELLLVWAVVLAVSALLQVWVLCSRIMGPMALRVVLHLHLLRMIFLHQ